MEKYIYIRKDKENPEDDRLISALKEHGMAEDHIFSDKASLKISDTPGFRRLLERIQSGDLLYIRTLDDLGANYQIIMERWNELTKGIGVDVAALAIPLLDTRIGRDLMGDYVRDLVSQILLSLKTKYSYRVDCQMKGIDAAMAKGVKFGRKAKPVSDTFLENARKWKFGTLSLAQAARDSGMPESTFYRKAKSSEFVHLEGTDSPEEGADSDAQDAIK